MSADKFKEVLNTAFDNGNAFIDYTDHYSYALIPQGDGNYREVSFDLDEKDFFQDEVIAAEEAYLRFLEEVEKGLSHDVEDFMLVTFKKLKKEVEGKPEAEQLKILIDDLVTDGSKYSENLPVIQGKGDLERLLSKL